MDKAFNLTTCGQEEGTYTEMGWESAPEDFIVHPKFEVPIQKWVWAHILTLSVQFPTAKFLPTPSGIESLSQTLLFMKMPGWESAPEADNINFSFHYGWWQQLLYCDPLPKFLTAGVHNFFGYVRGVSSKLQGSSLDIVEGYKMIGAVKQIIDETRKNEQEFDLVYSNASDMAVKAGLDELKMPRRCARQTHRNNVPASSDKEYFKRAIYLPYLDDELIQQLDMRFWSRGCLCCSCLVNFAFPSSPHLRRDGEGCL
ncbi:Hypothetical predicted protein [Mytilus galloprovincialis]|uniref:Uncharacterized protein n=1 Tax=Mytilus galloprovincialis TaxID=29158 RepID=A0A8B6FJK1_MYTGA|nr:Hypothetical predicted protein [Mytilus galloprovincialis]